MAALDVQDFETNACILSGGGFMSLEAVIPAAERAASELLNIRAFLVLWNESLISENYYGSTTAYGRTAATTPLHIRSITKSIVSALVGIAIDQGKIRGVNDKVVAYIPELESQDPETRKKGITIRHLLTMTSGFRWVDSGAWFSSQTQSAMADVWTRPLAHSPGDVYNYDSAATDLLTVILSRAIRGDAQAFLAENLFAPLAIVDFDWEKDPAGYRRGSAGLVMRAPDLAKFGQLYLQNGRWEERQIISPQWIVQSVAPQVRVNESVSYGYLWRASQVGSIHYYYALGYGGQYLIVVPGLNLVLVALHRWQVSQEEANQQTDGFMDRVFKPLVSAWQSPS